MSQRNVFEERIFAPVVDRYPDRSQKLCGFMALQGREYDNELMVVGRAVNTWGDGKSIAELQGPAARKEFIDEFFYPDGECQMAWVARAAGSIDEYNTNRSAFWRVIRQVSKRLGVWQDGDEEDWSSRLVWSNLYKISPRAGGNPSDKLCEIQEPGCIELLAREIREFTPERVLFLTGMDWARPFLEGLGAKRQAVDGLVEATGTIRISDRSQETRFIVAQHPQGRPEADWVEEVISCFESELPGPCV